METKANLPAASFIIDRIGQGTLQPSPDIEAFRDLQNKVYVWSDDRYRALRDGEQVKVTTLADAVQALACAAVSLGALPFDVQDRSDGKGLTTQEAVRWQAILDSTADFRERGDLAAEDLIACGERPLLETMTDDLVEDPWDDARWALHEGIYQKAADLQIEKAFVEIWETDDGNVEAVFRQEEGYDPRTGVCAAGVPEVVEWAWPDAALRNGRLVEVYEYKECQMQFVGETAWSWIKRNEAWYDELFNVALTGSEEPKQIIRAALVCVLTAFKRHTNLSAYQFAYERLVKTGLAPHPRACDLSLVGLVKDIDSRLSQLTAHTLPVYAKHFVDVYLFSNYMEIVPRGDRPHLSISTGEAFGEVRGSAKHMDNERTLRQDGNRKMLAVKDAKKAAREVVLRRLLVEYQGNKNALVKVVNGTYTNQVSFEQAYPELKGVPHRIDFAAQFGDCTKRTVTNQLNKITHPHAAAQRGHAHE